MLIQLTNPLTLISTHLIVVFRAGILKLLVRIANREDPGHTVSPEAV